MDLPQNWFMTKGSTCILYQYYDNEVEILELKYGQTQNWFMAKGSTRG
jgi:hypothetical protein